MVSTSPLRLTASMSVVPSLYISPCSHWMYISNHIKIVIIHLSPLHDFVTWRKFPSHNGSILDKIDADSRHEKCPHSCLWQDYTRFQYTSVFSYAPCALYIFVERRTHDKNICPLAKMGQRTDMRTKLSINAWDYIVEPSYKYVDFTMIFRLRSMIINHDSL